MVTGEPLIKIDVFADGDFVVFDGKSGKELTEISMGEFVEILGNKISVKDSVVSPLITYLKTGSGVIIIGGRRYPIP